MRSFSVLLVSVFLLLGCTQEQAAPVSSHPRLSISQSEAHMINAEMGDLPLLVSSFQSLQEKTDAALTAEMEVPQPGESGGYAHERHKQNYRDMKNAGYMFTFTGDERYAQFVKQMLDKYAMLYPTLGPHPLAHNQKPGKLFHQILNETVWLLNTAQAYDCIYDWLGADDRARFEKNIFLPMVEWFSVKHAEAFDQIHNHGMWATAAVGMIGLVMDDDELVNRALYGTENNGTGGFLAQIEHLFSPDGYYMEGAYYVRYAMRPLLFFAEALERSKPSLNIYAFRDQIIKKAFYSAVQMTYPTGSFIPINDASRSMDIKAPGVLFGTSVIYNRYGFDENLLGLAKIQGEVYPNGSGLIVARGYHRHQGVMEPSWPSMEFSDGDDGQQGGFGILRSGKGKDQTVLAMKYGVHGMGHGHFDKLNFVFFDQGYEVISDYGFARWINIEPKFGGRYLPENNSYAKQTIAHNTLVVDGRSQNDFDRKAADRVHGNRHFFDARDPNIQVMSATANDHYDGVKMQRTLFLVDDDRLEYPVAVDIYRVVSDENHAYDMPIHHAGQIMSTSFDYKAESSIQKPLGNDHGYQHIWKTAAGPVDRDAVITWLDGHRYYSYLTDITGRSEIIFGMIGASDPSFNLRKEPLIIHRTTGKHMVFASILEPHGYFNEATETSVNANPSLQAIEVKGHSDQATVVEVQGIDDLSWTLMINNGPADPTAEHKVTFSGKSYSWTGNHKVILK